MTALPLNAAATSTRATPELAALPSGDDRLEAATAHVTATRRRSLSCTLDLSRSRTHYAALDILRAYKLSGNFHFNLDAVLKDMGVFDIVTYQIEPNPNPGLACFPDCQHVAFTFNANVPGDIVGAIKAKIGFELPWWVTMLRPFQPQAAAVGPMRRTRD